MKTTKNWPLLIGIALPIIFILIISLVIFTPNLSIKPAHNFLYSNESPYYYYNDGYSNTFSVSNGKLVTTPVPAVNGVKYKGDYPPIYLYDVKNNSTHQISVEEARNFYLDPGPSSPDGYTVEYKYSNSGIFELFGSGSRENGYVISKGNGVKRLNGLNSTDRYYSSGNFKLIGWVK
ncbi:MAG: hypothetical protein AB198_02570 [Parcubacteria bacterium C7867-003]|nr:MAG: hypothetical protein AB198_02570 [Parcubacteria bacterium C7867-003]